MFPSACARYGSTGHTVLSVLPRIVTPVAVQVAVSRGFSDRIAIRTISFLHASPERDMLPVPAASVQHPWFFIVFSLHFLWIFYPLCGLLRDEEGKVFILCKEINVTLFIVPVKQLRNDSQLVCSARAVIQALHTDPGLQNTCLDVGCWPFWKERPA